MEQNEHYIYDNIVGLYGDNFIKNFPKIANHISSYINKRSDILQTRNVGLHLYYTNAIENEFYACCDIEKSQIDQIIKDSPNINHSIHDQVLTIYNFLMILSCFYERHQKEMEKMYGTRVIAYKLVRFYLALRIYSIGQRQIFPYEPKEDIMEYVVNHLNQRFDLSKVTNIYSLIQDYANSNNKALEIDFTNIKDVNIYQWVSKLLGRFKSLFKNMFGEYIKARDANQTTQTEDIELVDKEEGKTYLTITTNVSNTIEIYTNKISQKFIQDSEPRKTLIQIACKKTNRISSEKLTMIINSIRKSKDNVLMSSIIKNIVSYWVISLKQDINNVHSIEFIKKCSSAYAISNTYDIFIGEIKKTLADLINKYSKDYIDTEKKSTLNSFKQAVFLYMVFYISSLN